MPQSRGISICAPTGPFLSPKIPLVKQSDLIALAAGVLSGGLLVLAMPIPDMGLLAWVWLVPGMGLLVGSDPHRRILIGCSAGMVSGIGKVYWVGETLVNYGGLSYGMGELTAFLLAIYLGLYVLAFFWLVGHLTPDSLAYPFYCASLWTTLEWLQTHLLTGFPWMLLGCTQHQMLPILQSARIWGVYGIGFLVVAVNGSIVALQALGWAGRRSLFGPASLLLAVLAYGFSCLSHRPPEHPFRAGIVQGSIPQGQKWQTDYRKGTVDRYETLVRQVSGADLDLIVLPETALPFDLEAPENSVYFDRMKALAGEVRTPLLVGSLAIDGQDIHNRVFLIGPDGVLHGYQDKVHLVPFGEYLPMEWLFGYMEGLTRESGRFSAGLSHRSLTIPPGRDPFGVFVCYESIFPGIARACARDGATFLVNVTNDAWFGSTAAPYQHFAMGVLRAVENGLPLLRAANTGISGAVDANGRILARTPLFEPAVLRVDIFPSREHTLYTRFGDWLVGLCAIVAIVALLGAHRHARLQDI